MIKKANKPLNRFIGLKRLYTRMKTNIIKWLNYFKVHNQSHQDYKYSILYNSIYLELTYQKFQDYLFQIDSSLFQFELLQQNLYLQLISTSINFIFFKIFNHYDHLFPLLFYCYLYFILQWTISADLLILLTSNTLPLGNKNSTSSGFNEFCLI